MFVTVGEGSSAVTYEKQLTIKVSGIRGKPEPEEKEDKRQNRKKYVTVDGQEVPERKVKKLSKYATKYMSDILTRQEKKELKKRPIPVLESLSERGVLKIRWD